MNNNLMSKTRAGRCLGRAHAALDEHTLSVAALEAALEGTKTGELLFSECLTLRARALVGKAAAAKAGEGGSSSPHWSEATGKQRLQEVMRRMGGGGDNEEQNQLLEKLLLHGLG